MELETIKLKELVEFLKKSFKTQDSIPCVVILTDGESLYGEIPGKTFIDDVPIFKFVEDANELVIQHMSVHYNECSIYIPINQIAGVSFLELTRETIPLKSSGSPILDSIKDLPKFTGNYEELSEKMRERQIKREGFDHRRVMLEETLKIAEQRHFRIQKYAIDHLMAAQRPFRWGKITFERDTPLYCDWEYLTRISGGVTSLGVGIPGFSLSAGWSKSLWKSFKDKVFKKSISLNQACSQTEVLIGGYITPLTFKRTKKRHKNLARFTMEGKPWISMVITSKKVGTLEELRKSTFIVCYFKDDAFIFPKDLLKEIADPIRIFGESVSTTFETDFGKAECFVKARAASYIKNN